MSFHFAKIEELEQHLFHIENEEEFTEAAITLFHFQYQNNPLYKSYCDLLHCSPDDVTDLTCIPFLPISFFKTHAVKTTGFDPQIVFESSGTTGSVNSKHFIKNAALYERSFFEGFTSFYGPVENYCILALLPSYLERGSSSLVYMVKNLMEKSGHPDNDFYLYDHKKLTETLTEAGSAKTKNLVDWRYLCAA